MQLLNRFRFALTSFGLLTALFMASAAVAQDKDKEEDKTKSSILVLKDATIHSMGPEGIFVGSILIEDGKIKSVGEKVETPDDATVYELKGFHLTPGLIDSRSKLWLTQTAIAEGNAKAELNVVDAIDPWSEDWKELAAQGITSVYVQPNSTGAVGGMGAVLRVGPHQSVDDIVMKDEVAVQVSIGTRGRSSKDRYTQIQALEKLLKSAQDKKKDDKDKKNHGDKKDADKDKESDKKDADDKKDKEDDDEKKDDDKKKDEKDKDDKKDDEKKNVTKEIFKRVLKREIPLFVEVHHSDAVKRVLALAKEFKIRVVLDGLTKAESCIAEIQDSNLPIVIGPFVESGAIPVYRKDANLDWVSEMKTDETSWAISSFASNSRGSQALRLNAAVVNGGGVESSQVLKSLTTNAARLLGVADHVGTIEEGKQADIAVFAGDPVDSCSPTRLVISHGHVTFESKVKPMELVESETVSLPARLPESYVVKTTRLLRDGKFTPGSLVVSKGKVTAVGTEGTESKNDEDEDQVFDLGDTIVTPGLVIAHTSLGQAAAINDSTESDASHLRAVDAFDPTTKKAKETLADGFVHIGLAPGTSNTSSGAMGHVRLGSGDYVASATTANQFVFATSARNRERFPASLNGQVRLVSDLFSGKLVDSRVYLSDSVADSIADEKLACIQEVAGGKRKAVFIANDKVEIRSILAIAKANEIEGVSLASSGPVGDLADELAEENLGLIVLPIGVNDLNRPALQIKAAIEAGVQIGFAGDSAKQIRTTASMLVAAGVPAEKVLRGLTEDGASVVGMKNVGFAAGMNADFVVWSDSPLNFAAKPLNVVVDGKPVSKK